MSEYTHDWISGYHSLWEKLIKFPINAMILEIGCFEGRSTVWFLEHFPSGVVMAIDTFEGSDDLEGVGIDWSEVKARFHGNTKRFGYRVQLNISDSKSYLYKLGAKAIGRPLDLIFVDGSHVAKDVIQDLILSWPLLTQDGYMIIDDYGWGQDRHPLKTPKPAVDAFLALFEGEYEIVHKEYQVILRKTV